MNSNHDWINEVIEKLQFLVSKTQNLPENFQSDPNIQRVQHQVIPNELFNVRQPSSSAKLAANQRTQIIANMNLPKEIKHFDRLVDSYLEYINLVSTEQNRDGPEKRVVIKLVEVAQAFNYAFDSFFLIPLARHIYQWLVEAAFRSKTSRIDNIKLVCTPLDGLRSKMFDRQPFPFTKKAGVLMVLNLIFKCYLEV